MSDGQPAPTRPIGWWLKEADTLLDAAFDAALEGYDVDRRAWQVLTSLAREPMRRTDVLASLASFDPPDVLDEVLQNLSERGWIEECHGHLQLTERGTGHQKALAVRVDTVRQKVAAALPQDDYAQLVSLLARLVEGIRPSP